MSDDIPLPSSGPPPPPTIPSIGRMESGPDGSPARSWGKKRKKKGKKKARFRATREGLPCITPGCVGIQEKRGICQWCATIYRRLRKEGRVTDEQAVALGLVLPRRPPGAPAGYKKAKFLVALEAALLAAEKSPGVLRITPEDLYGGPIPKPGPPVLPQPSGPF